MQQNVARESAWRRIRFRLATLFIVTCLVGAMALVIKFTILPDYSHHDASDTLDNKTTQYNDPNQSTTDTSTTYFLTEITSLFNDTGLDTSSISLSDQWIIDSSLIQHRTAFALAVMGNGEILFSGGSARVWRGSISVSSCETYSPLHQRWQTIPDMQTLRSEHTLTTLQNGKSILAVGSTNGLDSYTAEIYDLETNRWTFVRAVMDVGRFGHTATLLQNGQVLIVGGRNPYPIRVNSNTQLYDPSLNTFITTGSLNRARLDHTATLLSDGLSVLVIGGTTQENDDRTTAEVYREDIWSYTTNDMNVTRYHHAAVLLSDGNVLVAGGSSRSQFFYWMDYGGFALSSVEIYNSTTNTFSSARPMACERAKLTLTLLPSGLVLATGGIGPRINECPLVSELYDPKTDQWMSVHLLNNVRYDHETVLINSSVLLAIGGQADEYTDLEQCEKYHL